MKRKDKICGICQLVIDERKEFCQFIHFERKRKIKSRAYYHIQCFRDKLSGGAELRKLQEQAKQIFNVASQKMSMV